MEEKRQLERGGNDMTNNVVIELKINNETVEIIVNDSTKKKLSKKNKTINTKEIFSMLKYSRNKKYKLVGKKISERDLKGEQNEIKRLYNYTFDLFSEIINSVNDINKELKKDNNQWKLWGAYDLYYRWYT